ncbi:hypothetical protein HC341_14100 [Aquisalimonas sp. 2447]|uniref:hypothetical protein n=1 Tax=Aquisalimonas sp. 2447 TaxID=2740807 RepID=UPI001432615C|nr:hypothetical protein [Aquisalimonas sp. 2447]QIT56229.1 hypothetical protein HC341_14100 [Aquisalimonas sp. 2447]
MKAGILMRVVLAWVLAVVVAAALGSIVQSVYNMSAIAGLGVDVPIREWFRAPAHDLVFFAPFWAAVVAVALLLGLPVAALLARLLGGGRHSLYFLAGGVAVMFALGLMATVLPITPIAAARFPTAMALMALGGAVGGLVFARLTPGRAAAG